jgi:hypothetical protein
VPGKRYALILRLWTEVSASSTSLRPALRGSLQQVNSDEIRYFSSLDTIPEIVRQMMGWQDPPSSVSTEKNESS